MEEKDNNKTPYTKEEIKRILMWSIVRSHLLGNVAYYYYKVAQEHRELACDYSSFEEALEEIKSWYIEHSKPVIDSLRGKYFKVNVTNLQGKYFNISSNIIESDTDPNCPLLYVNCVSLKEKDENDLDKLESENFEEPVSLYYFANKMVDEVEEESIQKLIQIQSLIDDYKEYKGEIISKIQKIK